MERLTHGFPPLVRTHSTILILGSFPSVKSRESAFFYMHPQNKFWRILADVYGDDFVGTDIDAKTALLVRHGLALYDVVEACAIHGSGDASIRDVVPSDLEKIMAGTEIRRIVINGAKAWQLFQKYDAAYLAIAVPLPSTSPANAAMPYDTLLERWKQALSID
ncbi:MAG: DNA-deoxyinosine glycosylase [Bacillota bacterium]|nr:DNA-deoxyinosine glycosylase [Bacillota bacterium]